MFMARLNAWLYRHMKGVFQLVLIVVILGSFTILGIAWKTSTELLQPGQKECTKEWYLYCGKPSELGFWYQDVMIETEDKLKISGWYIPGKRKAPGILMVPGWGDTRHVAMRYVNVLNSRGFNLLLIDIRNSGESDGTFNSMGYFERKDIHAAVKYLLKRRKLPSVGVMGFSTGASTAIMAMAENKDISSGIFDAGFTDFQTWIGERLQKKYGVLSSLLLPLTASLFEKRSKADIDNPTPIKVIASISPRPVFIIHGSEDHEIDFDQGKRLYVTASQPKRFWPVSGGGHLRDWQTNSNRAEKEIPDFFQDSLPVQ